MHIGQQTNPEMPPQFLALEAQSADTPLGRDETGLRRHKTPGVQHGREGHIREDVVIPVQAGHQGSQYVFVLDRRGNPLMPCQPARANELLRKGRAVVLRISPFVIRLKDRLIEDSTVQPIRLGVDPGSKTTGMALSRQDADDVRHVLFKLEVGHRSELIHKRMQQRAAYRRRRRSANLRYRAPRYSNRTKPKGWLAPSLRSRVEHVETWARRLQRWSPISAIDLELVSFDTQLMRDAEIAGVDYQHGTLAGYEAREYLLAKFGRRCVYCDVTDVPLNIDHVLAKIRGGSDQISNLALACIQCNQRKGDQRIDDFSPSRAGLILANARASLRDAAAVNATRFATRTALSGLCIPVECSTGGRTKFNRREHGIPKTHALDAVCVGTVGGVQGWGAQTLCVQATGRGSHQRTKSDRFGFTRLVYMRAKRVHGFATGDLVRANVPKGKYAGVYIGRVAVRARGSFSVGSVADINYRYCQLLQRQDGYSHALL